MKKKGNYRFITALEEFLFLEASSFIYSGISAASNGYFKARVNSVDLETSSSNIFQVWARINYFVEFAYFI